MKMQHRHLAVMRERGNFLFRVDVNPEGRFPISNDMLRQKFREVCFNLNKRHIKGNGRKFGKLNMLDKFWFVVSEEIGEKGGIRHYHSLLNVPTFADQKNICATIAWSWKLNGYSFENSNRIFDWRTERQIEGDREFFPWEREYPLSSYAKFPLKFLPPETLVGSFLYNTKKDIDVENWFFVGLSETKTKN